MVLNIKKKIKTYKNNIDVLTLSATPIHFQTLQMSLTGVRNLSLIEATSSHRLQLNPVLIENKQIIKDAIYKRPIKEWSDLCFI